MRSGRENVLNKRLLHHDCFVKFHFRNGKLDRITDSPEIQCLPGERQADAIDLEAVHSQPHINVEEGNDVLYDFDSAFDGRAIEEVQDQFFPG
jgi:hypothetical protein